MNQEKAIAVDTKYIMGPNPFRNRIETVKTFHDRFFFQTFKSVICNEKFENVS